jgi:hypothetical protein
VQSLKWAINLGAETTETSFGFHLCRTSARNGLRYQVVHGVEKPPVFAPGALASLPLTEEIAEFAPVARVAQLAECL